MPRKHVRRSLLALGALCVAVAFVVPRARATIEEQRARLPPAAECADESVAGTWRSHQFEPRRNMWTIFELQIRRVNGQPNRLEGIIVNHSWDGYAQHQEPPPCGPINRSDWWVSMDGVGEAYPDGRIQFGGIGEWRMDRVICGAGLGRGEYNLDNFTGVIDPVRLEFQSVNNDGGWAVNEPTLFRRIRCPPMESAQAPSVNPVPPDFYPDTSTGCLSMMAR